MNVLLAPYAPGFGAGVWAGALAMLVVCIFAGCVIAGMAGARRSDKAMDEELLEQEIASELEEGHRRALDNAIVNGTVPSLADRLIEDRKGDRLVERGAPLLKPEVKPRKRTVAKPRVRKKAAR